MPAEEQDPRLVICHLGGVDRPDLGTIEALARFNASLRRLGCRVELSNPSPRLLELIELLGLRDALGLGQSSTGIDAGKAEEGKETLGVEEVVEPGDPAL